MSHFLNSLQRLSADDKLPQTRKELIIERVKTGIQFGIGHSPKIVPDVREFAVQFGQFVRDDFQKRTLYGNAH